MKKIKKQARGRFRISQNLEFVLRDANGNIKQLFQLNKLGMFLRRYFGINVPNISLFGRMANSMNISNLVVNAGLAGMASRLNGAGAENAFTYIAIGTGTGAEALTDTALGTEITTNGGARAAATASRVTTDVANDTAQLVLTYNFTGSFAVTESGVFNDASAGTMLARKVFSAINVASGDSLQITWKFDLD